MSDEPTFDTGIGKMIAQDASSSGDEDIRKIPEPDHCFSSSGDELLLSSNCFQGGPLRKQDSGCEFNIVNK